jgi:GxxExxY protein
MNHEETKDTKWDDCGVSKTVIGAAMRVHRELGPGLLESVYHRCLVFELRSSGLAVASEVPLNLNYRGISFGCAYRADLIVGASLLVEVKAIQKLEPIHLAQIITYLKLAHLRARLLLNFNVPRLRDGLKRIVCGPSPSRLSSLRGQIAPASHRGEA